MERGCPNCGRMVDASSKRCPYCNYDLTKLNGFFKQYEEELNIVIPKYAGFIKRMAANGIDMLFLSILFVVVEGIYLYFVVPSFGDFSLSGLTVNDFFIIIIPYLFLPIIYFLYCVFMQCSKSMATLGERFVGIEVVDDLESPMTFGLSFKRNFLRILNVLTLGIGTLMIIFTKKKQSLGDMASHTFVLNRVTDEKYNGFSYAHLFVRFVAFIIDVVILYAIYYLFGYLFDGWDTEIGSTILEILPIIMVVIIVFYFPYMECRSGASIGKSIMKLKVVKMDGEKPGFFRCLFRFISCFLELLILPFGTLLAFVMPRKQTFKDLLTKTFVVSRF